MTSVQVKAVCPERKRIRDAILASRALFDGEDRQVDACFRSAEGRLILRTTDLDRDLLVACRDRVSDGFRRTESEAAAIEDTNEIRRVLEIALPLVAVVRKTRETFVEQNVHLRLDRVEHLGDYLEIEAIVGPRETPESAMRDARRWLERFGLSEDAWIAETYTELLAR
jgi:predicted adenylyl cyclase CyaB